MPPTQVKAIFAIAFGYGAGLWFGWQALRRRALLKRAKHWFPAPGRILESTLYKDTKRNRTHFRIRYEFTVDERIEGCTPRISGDWFWDAKTQEEFVAQYTEGQAIEVYYDPRNPKHNCLDRTDARGISALWAIAAGGTVLATLMVGLLVSGD